MSFGNRLSKAALAILASGVILAGCGGGDTPKPDSGSTAAEADSLAKLKLVLARVGDIEITGADIRNHMLKRSSPRDVDNYLSGKGGADVLQVALASLMDQYVWSEMAKKDGFELTPEEAAEIRALESEHLATRYVGQVVQGKAKPAPEEVEQEYLQEQAKYLKPYRAAIRHILVGTQAEAERLKAEAQGGADFASLAKQYSTDATTRNIGGAMGYVQTNQPVLGLGRDPAFTEAVLAMSEGEYGVIKSRLGWHVVHVEKKEGGELIPLEDVYDDIAQHMLNQRFGKVYNRELSAAREEMKASFDDKNFEIFCSTIGNTGRLLRLAYEIPDPKGQIEAFRRLTYDFPQSREAAEAQFMVAYLCVTKTQDLDRARRELSRLQRKFRRSPWAKAGDYLKQHLDDPPESFGKPEEILKATQESGR